MTMKQLVIICGTIMVLVGVIAFTTYKVNQNSVTKAKIQAEKELEQTEERSQFWQKLVPWGEDEEDIVR
jgi:uncharacterized protein YpmB